ncbi:MAG TPA: hypothetical protein VFQ61_08605 [Polyangiaceae bacterium]|nr:hypothetical protein [Polyangiaceae bacterium]
MSCPDVDPELHVVALVSRTFRGARTSDLHAWDWSHVDTAGWVERTRAQAEDENQGFSGTRSLIHLAAR